MPGSSPAENLLSNWITWFAVLASKPPDTLVSVATVELVIPEIVASAVVLPERNTTSPFFNVPSKLVPTPLRLDVDAALMVLPVIP